MKKILLLSLLAVTPAFAAKKAADPPPPVVEAPAVDPEAWRATPPSPGAEGDWKPPSARSFTLGNGIPVYLVENPGLPLVSLRLVLEVGREANPAGKAGLAALTANLLDEGTKSRGSAQIASDAAMLGAELSVAQGDETAVIALDALTGEPLGPSIELMADVARNPKFAGSDFERVQAETLTAIQGAKADPRDAAMRTFLAQLYGASHPYGSPSVGSDASVRALTRADVKKFYKSWWHAGNASFVVSGAVDEAGLRALLEPAFGGWKARTGDRAAPPAPSAPARTRVVFVEQAGAVQSVLRVGGVGPRRTAPEFMASNVAGTLVGGMFSSRININLREEHGWSYGAYGGFSESRDAGSFVVRTQVQADKTAPAVTEILKELAAARARAPTEAELTLAKDSLLKSLAGNFETNAYTASSFLAIPAFGLAPDYWASWVTDLQKVDTAASESMAKRWFDPNTMLVVVVGPRTVEVADEAGGKKTVDVVAELKALGFEYVEQP